MSDVLGDIIVEVKASQAKLDSDLKRIDGNLKKEGEKLSKSFADTFKSGIGFIAGSAVLTGSMNFLKGAIESYVKAEAAEKRLEIAYGRSIDKLVEYAEALQNKTAFADDDIVSAQARIAAFIKEENSIKKVTEAALDFSVAMGQDLDSSAQLITKTIASETNALARYGIKVEGAANSSERLDSVMKSLNEKFGGQAQAQLETYAGKMQLLANAWDNVLEKIGKVSLDSIFAGIKTIFGGGSFSGNLLSQQLNAQLAEVYKKVRSDFNNKSKTNNIIDTEELKKATIDYYEAVKFEDKNYLQYRKDLIRSEIAELQKTGLNKIKLKIYEISQLKQLDREYKDWLNSLPLPYKLSNTKPRGYETQNFTSTLNDTNTPKTIKNSAWEQMIWGLKAQEGLMVEQKNLWGDLQSASSQAMGNLVSQWAGAINVIKNANSLLEQFINTLAQVGLQQLATYAIGSFSGGGILGGIASLFGGGSSSPGASAKPAIPIVQGGNKTNIMNWKVDNQSLLLSTESASKIKATYY